MHYTIKWIFLYLTTLILFWFQIHGRALQNHTQIPINDGSSNSPAAMLNSCSSTCSETLSYFCNDCNVACCSNCTLCSHKLHNFISLLEKVSSVAQIIRNLLYIIRGNLNDFFNWQNRTLIPQFNKTYMHIEETLLRVCQTKEVSTHFIKYFSWRVTDSIITRCICQEVINKYIYLLKLLTKYQVRVERLTYGHLAIYNSNTSLTILTWFFKQFLI